MQQSLAIVWKVAIESLHENCHVNGTTFQSGFEFQTGLSSLRVSCKRALKVLNLFQVFVGEAISWWNLLYCSLCHWSFLSISLKSCKSLWCNSSSWYFLGLTNGRFFVWFLWFQTNHFIVGYIKRWTSIFHTKTSIEVFSS